MRQIPLWAATICGLFVARFITLSMSSFSWYHGFNEAVYTEIAYGFNSHPFLPMRGGAPFFDTGPFSSYMMWISQHFLGVSEASTRFGVLLAYPVAVWAAYKAGEGFHGPGKGKIAALLIASSPFVLLWFGRAQTDAWMTAGILLFFAGLAEEKQQKSRLLLISGLAIGLLSKQPAILALSALPFLRGADKKWKVNNALIGVAVGASWWVAELLLHREAMLSSLFFHTHDRVQVVGENALWVTMGVIVGSGSILFFSFLAKKPLWILAVPTALFFLFALLDSPIGHEYYALPAVALLGLVAAGWKWDNGLVAAAVVMNVVMAGGLLAWTGDLDDHQTRDIGLLVQAQVPAGSILVAPDRLVPQVELYSGGHHVFKPSEVQNVTGFFISWNPMPSCFDRGATSHTMKNPPLHLFFCSRNSQVKG